MEIFGEAEMGTERWGRRDLVRSERRGWRDLVGQRWGRRDGNGEIWLGRDEDGETGMRSWGCGERGGPEESAETAEMDWWAQNGKVRQ